jgi:hypothetical protein
MITGPQGFDRTVTFDIAENPAVITQGVGNFGWQPADRLTWAGFPIDGHDQPGSARSTAARDQTLRGAAERACSRRTSSNGVSQECAVVATQPTSAKCALHGQVTAQRCEADSWLPIDLGACLGYHALTEIRNSATVVNFLRMTHLSRRDQGFRTSPSSPCRVAGNPVCRPAPGSARSPGYSCPSVR